MSSNARDILGQLEDLPPLPAVAARVMGLADDDRTSALDLAQVLSTDQALTARLIKISNSAYYGFARRVGTVREAVLVLGFKQVRQLAVGASLVNSFKRNRLLDGVFDLDLFWGHSVATAVAGEAIAKKTRAARPEDAFTAGILHDIGRLVISQVMPREFADAVTFARSNHSSLHEAETRLTGFDHAA
ncbi:HDOD domain-containing protein, partial [bacterium]